jgi:hypothetical protein
MISTVLFYSCSSQIIGKGPYTNPDDVKKESGLVYYVGKDIIKVEGKVNNISARWLNEALEIESARTVTYDAGATFQTIADFNHAYILELKPGEASKDYFKIETRENGLLKSFNISSEGKGGDILVNMAKAGAVIAGVIAPPAIPIGLGATVLTAADITPEITLDAADPKVEPDCKKNIKKPPKKKTPTPKQCHEDLENFHKLPVMIRALIKNDERACLEWKNMLDLDKKIAAKQKERLRIEDKIAGSDEKKLKVIKTKVAYLESSIKNLNGQKTISANRFQGYLNQFESDGKLGKKVSMVPFKENFEFHDIPPASLVETAENKIQCLQNSIKTQKTQAEEIIKAKWDKYIIGNLKPGLFQGGKIDLCTWIDYLSNLKKDRGLTDYSPTSQYQQNYIDKVLEFPAKWLPIFNRFVMSKGTPIKIEVLKEFEREAKGLIASIEQENHKVYQKKVKKVFNDFKTEKLRNYPKMTKFFEKTGVIVTLDDKSNLKKSLQNKCKCIAARDCKKANKAKYKCKARSKSDDKGESDEDEMEVPSDIFYRQSIPMLLSFYGVDVDRQKLSRFGQELVQVMHPDMPVYHFKFEGDAFAKRQLSLVFNAQGQPIVVERSGSSSLKGLTDAVSQAAVTARDEYVTTLEKMVQAQGFKRTLQLGDITTRIEALKKEKELLDTQLGLDAAGATYEDVLAKQQAQAQLEALNAQFALESQKTTSELLLKQQQMTAELQLLQLQLTLQETQETQLQKLEVAKLKLLLEKLKLELDLIKTKLEKDKAESE